MFQVLCFLTMIIHGSKNVNYKTTVELVDHAFLSMITIGWHLQIITGKSIDPILGTNWSNHVPIIIWILGSLQRIHVKLLLPKIGINLITSTLLIDRHDLWTRGQVPQCQLIMKINTNPLKVKTILNFSWHYGMAGMHTNDPTKRRSKSHFKAPNSNSTGVTKAAPKALKRVLMKPPSTRPMSLG